MIAVMKKISGSVRAFAALCLVTLAGCFGGDGTQQSLAQAFAFSERQGAWFISCPRGPQPGTVSECRLGRMSAPGDVQGIDNTLLIRATPAGIAVDDPDPRFAQECGRLPTVHRVDDTPLVGVPASERIALLSSGRVYFKEVLTRSPDCRMAVGTTDLSGFGPAYARFVEVSASFGFPGVTG
jgi:hypothetical protein